MISNQVKVVQGHVGVLEILLAKARFDESKHQRDRAGRFAQKAERSSSVAPPPEDSVEAFQQDLSFARSPDQIHEALAKRIAYIDPGELTNPNSKDPKAQVAQQFLKQHGLAIDTVIDDRNTGLTAFGLTSSNPGDSAKLVFTGTNEDKDWESNKDNNVGDTQFREGRSQIEDFLRKVDGKVDITGHSLGGALTMQAALNFPDKVASVTTFNAPGLTVGMNQRFAESMQRVGVKPVHYIMNGDMVSDMGDAMYGEPKLMTPQKGHYSNHPHRQMMTNPEWTKAVATPSYLKKRTSIG